MVGNFGKEKIVRESKGIKKTPKWEESLDRRDERRQVRAAKRTWQ